MLELLQHLVNLEWRRRGASFRHLPVAGSRVWYAEFPPCRSDRVSAGASVRPSPTERGAEQAKPPTVVLFHGLGASSTSFHSVIPDLRKLYRVIVPDLPGYGLSRPPPGREFLPFTELVDVAEKFLARVAPRGAYLAGNSMGGWIAAKVAARCPGLVRGMALLNPGGPALRAEDWVDFARIILAEERGVMDEWLRRMFHKPPLFMRFFTRDFRRIMRGPSVSQLMTSLRAEDFLSEEEMSLVRCPAVLVWGERDRLLPEGCRTFYLRKLKGVRYEPIPDCGHCPQLECPSRTAQILLDLPRALPRAPWKQAQPAPAGGGGSATPVSSRRLGGLKAMARVPKA
jgi:pimeloyl-ACP methyl ester carboxylesterase